MQSLTASTPCKPFRSICESFVNYCNLLLQFTREMMYNQYQHRSDTVRKHQGIGTRLLHTVELHLREHGKTAAHVHLGGKEYFESRNFYPKHGYKVCHQYDEKGTVTNTHRRRYKL